MSCRFEDVTCERCSLVSKESAMKHLTWTCRIPPSSSMILLCQVSNSALFLQSAWFLHNIFIYSYIFI